MKPFRSNSHHTLSHCRASRALSRVALAFGALLAAHISHAVIATDPVGYVSATLKGGTPSAPGLTFFSPTLANPVQWQGKVLAVDGATLTVSNADWASGEFDAAYVLEIASGPHAGLWTEVTTTEGDLLTTADPMDDLLSGGETLRIRRFTTLADFLGAANEAGLKPGAELADADSVLIYHASGARTYWYHDGSYGAPGWRDSSWQRAADTIIAPGEGVVLRRQSEPALPVYQTGVVKTSPQSVLVSAKRNFIGGITPVDLPLGQTQLYTGSPASGVAGGDQLATADTLVVYGSQTRSYWLYDGSAGGSPSWRDSSWGNAQNAVIPAGSTFVLERRHPQPFVWFLPPLLP